MKIDLLKLCVMFIIFAVGIYIILLIESKDPLQAKERQRIRIVKETTIQFPIHLD